MGNIEEICLWKLLTRIEQSRITLKSNNGFAIYVPKGEQPVNVKTEKVNDCYSCFGKPCEDYFGIPLKIITEHLRHELKKEFTKGKSEIGHGPETTSPYSFASNTLNDLRKCNLLDLPKMMRTRDYQMLAQFYQKHPEAYKILELLVENQKII